MESDKIRFFFVVSNFFVQFSICKLDLRGKSAAQVVYYLIKKSDILSTFFQQCTNVRKQENKMTNGLMACYMLLVEW